MLEKAQNIKMRLNKYLAAAGLGSRRAMDSAILQGQCQINGTTCWHPSRRVCLKSDIVIFDGHSVLPIQKKIIIMLHKPINVISTAKEKEEEGKRKRQTVLDLVPSEIPLRPVGRLDKDTSGLILLTNDGDLHQHLTHPRYGVTRQYEAFLPRRLKPEQRALFQHGLSIGRGDSGKKEIGRAEVLAQKTVKAHGGAQAANIVATLQMKHGKKREIRRMFSALDIPLVHLQRIRFGPLALGNLPPGSYRYLSPEETKSLYNMLG